MSAEQVLSRLKRVRQTSREQWIACCPAHDDRSPSLGIRRTDDGRVLLHCFAGCSVEEILGSMGLEVDTLFPGSASKIRVRPERVPFDPITVLFAVAHEAAVVVIVAEDLHRGASTDRSRLGLAAGRICRALDAIGERRLPEEIRELRRGLAT